MSTLILGNSFVSTGAGVNIVLPAGANYFKAVNLTQAATTQSTGRGIEFEWWADQALTNTPGSAYMKSKTNSTNALNASVISTGGYTYYPVPPIPQAPVTGTTITQATAAVFSATNTFSNGDNVLIYGVVGMRQISGINVTVSSVSGSSFTATGLNTSAFASAGTAFLASKIPLYLQVKPQYLYITNISQATQAVITTSTLNDYQPGMKIRLNVPSDYGMTQANQLEANILSVSDYNLTTDLNTSGFTAWSWPTTAGSVNLPRFATLAPDGQTAYYNQSQNVQYGYNVQQAPFRSSLYQQPFMYLAAGTLSPAGSTSDVIEWQAFTYGGQ